MDDKRAVIVRALRKCIQDKGYAHTSLTDVALASGMSPSHIRYYFDGKLGILEYYLASHVDQILADVRKIKAREPLEWLALFSSYFVGNSRIKRENLLMVLEAFGVSVHHAGLREIKQRYDAEIRSILTAFFERAGCVDDLTPAAAAEIAEHLDAGLKFNMVFRDELTVERANELFLAAVRKLLAPAKPPSRKTAKSRR